MNINNFKNEHVGKKSLGLLEIKQDNDIYVSLSNGKMFNLNMVLFIDDNKSVDKLYHRSIINDNIESFSVRSNQCEMDILIEGESIIHIDKMIEFRLVVSEDTRSILGYIYGSNKN